MELIYPKIFTIDRNSSEKQNRKNCFFKIRYNFAQAGTPISYVKIRKKCQSLFN